MPTLVNTIDSKELYAARAVADAAGNDIAQTYATKAELPTQVQSDWNQSVASAPDFIKNRPLSRLVPASTVYDQDMVLTVDASGNAGWGGAYILAAVSMMGPSDTIAQEMLDCWNYKQVVLQDPMYGKNLPLISITYDGHGYGLHNRIFNAGGVYDGKLYSISVFWNSDAGSWWWTSTETTVPDELTAGSGVEIVSNVVNAKVDGTTVTFDANGCLTATGGGSSVNADWDAVSGPEEILNKPTPKTLTAGSNITVTETASTITIGANVPAPTPQVNADWDAVSGPEEILNKPAVDQSYDGTSTNAQSGTAVAEAIGNLPTNLSAAQLLALKQALGVDETVLWEGTITVTGNSNLNTVIQLSESVLNFERIEVFCNNKINYLTWHPVSGNTGYPVAYQVLNENTSNDVVIGGVIIQESDYTKIRYRCGYGSSFTTAYRGEYWGYGTPYKVVGIRRVASN